jgi:hypothetical protein
LHIGVDHPPDWPRSIQSGRASRTTRGNPPPTAGVIRFTLG